MITRSMHTPARYWKQVRRMIEDEMDQMEGLFPGTGGGLLCQERSDEEGNPR